MNRLLFIVFLCMVLFGYAFAVNRTPANAHKLDSLLCTFIVPNDPTEMTDKGKIVRVLLDYVTELQVAQDRFTGYMEYIKYLYFKTHAAFMST